MPQQWCLAIVGGGPLATYAMAQLAAVLPKSGSKGAVTVTVFERSGRFGAGEVHSDAQPATNYLNRAAGQIAFAADESNAPPSDLLPRALRPTFLEWCAREYARTGDPELRLGPRDVPRRNLHGRALRQMFSQYVTVLRNAGVTVDLIAEEVIDCRPGGTDRYHLRTASGREVGANAVLFVTGHSVNRPAGPVPRPTSSARYVAAPYPLEQQITKARFPAGQPVLVAGLGLTAFDVILHLTEGRGGRFVPSDEHPEGLVYQPSGEEPSSIIAFSPSGVPVSGRPRNDKVLRGIEAEHRGRYFTVAAVEKLRSWKSGVSDSDQLDFDEQLLPLLILELALVYYRTMFGPEFADALAERVADRYEQFVAGGCPWGEAGIEHLLAPVQALFDEWNAKATQDGPPRRFNWQRMLEPLPPSAAVPGVDWPALVLEELRTDIARCERGNLADPVKAANDGVWRDLRAVFAAAVDHGGLTPESYRRFISRHLRYYNRHSNGAEITTIRKLAALIDAGVVDVSVGPEPVVRYLDEEESFVVSGRRLGVTRQARGLIEARVHPFDPARDVCPLYRNMLRHNLVRQWHPDQRDPGYAPGALHLDERFHPLRPDGKTSDRRLTFLGAPADGLRLFQLSLARPNAGSDLLNIIHRWSRELMELLSEDLGTVTPVSRQ